MDETKRESVKYIFQDSTVIMSVNGVEPKTVDLNELSPDVIQGLIRLGFKTKTRNHRCGDKIYGVEKFDATVEMAEYLEAGNYNQKKVSRKATPEQQQIALLAWSKMSETEKSTVFLIASGVAKNLDKLYAAHLDSENTFDMDDLETYGE